MADGRKLGVFAAIAAGVIAIVGVICCAFFPALLAGGAAGLASGRWWIGAVLFGLVILAFWLWTRREP